MSGDILIFLYCNALFHSKVYLTAVNIKIENISTLDYLIAKGKKIKGTKKLE